MENNTAVDRNQIVLEVKDLKKHFKSGSGKNKLIVPAVDGVSLHVYKREVFGLVGESGCGKTTTGRTIIKLYNATEGSVKLNGDLVSIGYRGRPLLMISSLRRRDSCVMASGTSRKGRCVVARATRNPSLTRSMTTSSQPNC